MSSTTIQRALPPHLDPRGPRVTRPPVGPGRRRGGPLRRLARAALVVLSALVMLVSVGGYVLASWFDGSIGRFHLGLANGGGDGSSNWLLVGTDSRAGSGGAYGDVPGQRSDTTILAHLAKDGSTTMVSIPRDTYVTIPAYDSGGAHHDQTRGKFTNALNEGGPALLVSTVEHLTGLPVDHYVSVDLAGFRQITDAVGGVDVCISSQGHRETALDDRGNPVVSSNTADPFSGWHGGPGTLHVDGAQALAFVRQRHGLPGGDLDRIKRQQQFLGSVFRSAASGGTLLDPGRVASLLVGVRDAVHLDDNTSSSDLATLADRVKGTDASKLVFTTLPVRYLQATDPGVVPAGSGFVLGGGVGAVEVYDQSTLDAFLAPWKGHASGSPEPAGPARPAGSGPDLSPATVAAAPSTVAVEVRNGTGRSGLARRVSGELAQSGFGTAGVGRSGGSMLAVSTIAYAPGDTARAQTLLAAVPGAQLVEDATLRPGLLVLTLGESFAGLHSLQPAAATTTAARAEAAAPAAPAAAAAAAGGPAVSAASAGNRCTS